jgi:hypothetical protein
MFFSILNLSFNLEILPSKVLASKNIVYNLAAGLEVFMLLCRRNLEEGKVGR